MIEAEFDAECPIAGGWEDIDGVAAHAEIAALKGDIVAVVLDVSEAANKMRQIAHFALRDAHGHSLVVVWRTDAVDAGNGRDDEGVWAG